MQLAALFCARLASIVRAAVPWARWRRGGRMVWAVVTIVTLGATGCASAPPAPLRIGLLVYPGLEPLYYARQRGDLDGDLVQLVDFSSSAEVTRALRNGLIDASVLTIFSGLQLFEGDPSFRAVLVTLDHLGGGGLVGGPGVTALDALRGRRIATNSSASNKYLIMRALDSVGVSLAEVTLVHVDEADQERALMAREVAAAAVYGPLTARMLAQGNRNLFDVGQLPGELLDVLLVRDETIQRRRASVQHAVDAWFLGRAAMLADPRQAAEHLAAREHTSPDLFQALVADIAFPDRASGARLLADPLGSLHRSVRQWGPQLVAHGELRQVPDLTRFVDDSFVRSAR